MLKQYELKMPREVFSGENALSHIADLIKESGKVGIYTDKGVRSASLLDPIVREIEKAGKPYQVFDELATEPSYMQVQENIDSFKTASCDYLIAVGGGSVMDAAKLTSVLLTDQYSVKDLLKSPLLGTKHIKTLMIPTTAGTGAEATPNAIVAVPEDNVKIGIVNSQMMAELMHYAMRLNAGRGTRPIRSAIHLPCRHLILFSIILRRLVTIRTQCRKRDLCRLQVSMQEWQSRRPELLQCMP